MNDFLNDIKAATETLENQTEVQSGFEREVTPAGPTGARLIGYVELGKRKQRPYQGKPKPDANMVRLTFELLGKKHRNEFTKEDGTVVVFYNTVSVTIAKKMSDKATFYKLLNRMIAGRSGITHMAQMLGEAFRVRVIHNEEDKDGKKVTYANLRDKDGVWTIGAPFRTVVNPETDEEETVAMDVPEATKPLQCLLWDNPTKAMWDSIFIDGTYTKKDEKGNEVEVSKNWLQEDIVANAVNFMGSPLEAVVGGMGDLTLEADDPATAPAEQPSEPPKPASQTVGAQAASSDDPLSQMGLQ